MPGNAALRSSRRARPAGRAGARLSTPAAVLALAAALTPTAAAQAAPVVDPRSAEARRLCVAGKPEPAVALLAQVIAETSDANAIYNQARCYQLNAMPEAAAARFREYLRVAKRLSDAERREVEGFLRVLDEDAVRRSRTVAPPSVASARWGGGEGSDRDGGAGPGADLESSSREPPSQARSSFPTTAVVAAGVGLAGVATGAYFGWTAGELRRQIEGWNQPVANGAYWDRVRRGRDAQRFQWIGYGVGGAALVTAALVYFLDDHDKEAEALSAGGLGVALVGEGGAAALLRGRF